MKTLITMAVMIGLLVTGPLTSAAETAPDWALASPDGETVRLSVEVRQQPVILFFWATWCPYCKALMPHLQSMQLEYGDSIRILAINFREKGDPVGFIKEKGYNFTVLPNGDDVAKLNNVYGTPGIIIVDGDQKITFDLRELPPYEQPVTKEKISHSKRAAFRAPYWAAAIRVEIDTVLKAASQ